MAGKTAQITIREKAAIIYHVITGEPLTEAYKIATRGELEKIEKSKNLPVIACNWKKSHKIQEYLEEFTTLYKARIQKEINKAIEEDRRQREGNERTNGKPNGKNSGADYSDPKSRQRLYNDIITNAADDPRTQLDAAKMFEQIQKDDREAAKAQKQSRVYLPLRCFSCPLYARQAKKIIK